MKPFGIKISLPDDNPMAKSHLLGPDWESYRWFDTEQQRDRVFAEMSQKHLHYRQGDDPRLVLRKVERESQSNRVG